MINTVFLVGFMGSGKSEVGRLLADHLDWSFVDLDEEISKKAGCSIPEIFEKEGEPGFRKRERDCLLEFMEKTEAVISCGGGIVTVPENLRDLISQPGSFCLQVTPEEVWKRIGQDPNRPMLQAENPQQRIRDLLASRAPFYDQFPHQVQTENFRTSEVVETLLSELRK